MQAWIFTDAPYQNSGTSNIVPAAACPAGTSIQYNHRRMARQGATGNWSSWQDAQTLHGVIPVGTRVDAEGQTRCVTSWTTSNWSGVATNYTVRPIPAPATPQMQAWIWAGGSSNGFGASNIVPAACPSGTSVGYEHRRMVRQGATGSWGSWRDQQSIVENIGQGARLDAEGRTRCSTPWANSGWSSNASNDTVKAITNSPNLSNWNAVIDSGSWVGHVAVDVANCPSGTSYQGKILVRKNHQDSWSEGSWGAVSSGRAHLYTSSTTFGQGDRFLGGGRLRCGTNWTVGPESSGYHAAWVNRPITTAPTLSNWNAIINSSNDYRGRVGVDVAGCPAGTRYDGQILVRRNEEGDWTSGSWGSVATGATRVGIDTVSSTWGQGERLLGGARIRCVSDFTTGPEAAGYHAEWQIRAITSQPTANVYVSRDGGNTYAGVNNLSSCPSISYARWRFADQENNGAWSGWSSWYTANGSYFARSIGYGSYTRASFNLQCVSAYTTGPVGTDAATSSTRPYPAPSAPSGVGGSVTRACNNSWWGGTVSWNSMSYATSYTVTVSWLNSSGNRVSKTMGSTSNTSMGISNTGAHWQPPTVLATVRASNGSGGNTTSNVSIPTVAGCRT